MIRVAIVEDDPAAVDRLLGVITTAADVAITGVARNMKAGLDLVVAGDFDVLLCDLGLPDGSGVAVIKACAVTWPEADIIVITVFADQVKVLESVKAGARGYLLKDERIEDCVNAIREIRRGGSPISPIIARQLLQQLQPTASPVAVAGEETLSPREAEVLNLLARGFSYAEIAALLSLSPQTIGTYVKRIYRKLEVNSRSEAVFEASNRGIMDVH